MGGLTVTATALFLVEPFALQLVRLSNVNASQCGREKSALGNPAQKPQLPIVNSQLGNRAEFYDRFYRPDSLGATQRADFEKCVGRPGADISRLL